MDSNEILLCSNCFRDEGLKLDTAKIGFESEHPCPNCKTAHGLKLNHDLVQLLAERFFVRGSLHRFEYGGAPLIVFNEAHYKNSSIDTSEWLKDDLALIAEAAKIGFFYYGPRAWMYGEVTPLISLQDEKERAHIIQRILKEYPTKILNATDKFYRIRINPQVPWKSEEYDSPPEQFIGSGRLDSTTLPILYGSQDLEVCIHECRATVDDEIYVAKLMPKGDLKLLDLTEILNEDTTEFESLDIALHLLFLAGKHSYTIARQIAVEASKSGYDGLIYPSYFSLARTGAMPFQTFLGMSIRHLKQLHEVAKSHVVENIALFGRPIKNEKVIVECINKVILNKVVYDYSFGPAYHKAFVDAEATE